MVGLLDLLVGMLSVAGLGLPAMGNFRGLTGVMLLFLTGSSAEGGLLLSVVFLTLLLVCGVDGMAFLLEVAGDICILSSPSFSVGSNVVNHLDATVPSSIVLVGL